MEPRKTQYAALVLWVLLAIVTLAAFGSNLREMALRWFPAWETPGLGLYDRLVEGESYYTHGPLVPLVSLFIIGLMIRHTRIPIAPSPKLGGLVLALSLALHVAGSLARVNFASSLAFVGCLVGLALLLWGRRALGRLWFPLAFLLFMVPLPEVTIAGLNFRLKMMSADLGVTLTALLGVPVERIGPRVVLAGGKSLVIANVCNGLRTLISLLAFGALYAFICRLRGAWRVGVFLAAVPIAVAANALRIVSLILVAQWWGEEVATGWWHDTSGLLIFVLAFMMMFSLERLILGARKLLGVPAKPAALMEGQLRSADEPPPWPAMRSAAGSRRAALAVAGIAGAAALSWWVSIPISTASEQQALERAIPATVTAGGDTWISQQRRLTDRELLILEYPSYLYRRYRQADGPGVVDYCLLFSRDNRKGIHPPDLCVEGFGQGITHKADFEVQQVPGRGSVAVSELVLHDGRNSIYMLYTYKCGGGYSSSFWWQQVTIFAAGLLRRDSSGGMIRISTPCNDGLAAARGRASEFLRLTVPRLDRALSESASAAKEP